MAFLRVLGRILLVVLVGGLMAQALIVYAPGYDSDERELDPGLSAEARQALHAEKSKDSKLLVSYSHFLKGLTRGDLGNSTSMGRPVSELLLDRFPVTLQTISKSVTLAWLLGLSAALLCCLASGSVWETAGQIASNLLLCLPVAVTALLLLIWMDARTVAAVWVVGLALTPRIFRYSYNLLRQSYESPHILLAKAKGLGAIQILFHHVLPPVASQLVALAGVSVSLALSASIPAEAILDVPGIGQLAWQAALSRDLNLLVSLTFIVALVGTTANAMSDHLIEQEAAV